MIRNIAFIIFEINSNRFLTRVKIFVNFMRISTFHILKTRKMEQHNFLLLIHIFFLIHLIKDVSPDNTKESYVSEN